MKIERRFHSIPRNHAIHQEHYLLHELKTSPARVCSLMITGRSF